MLKEELMKKNRKELLRIAKDFDVVGRWDMKKEDLILNVSYCVAHEQDSNKKKEIIEKYFPKYHRLTIAELGTLVAFKISENKAIAAKIIYKENSKGLLKVETEYGAVFRISFYDVIWVKTGKRWPRKVYELLKGIAS